VNSVPPENGQRLAGYVGHSGKARMSLRSMAVHFHSFRVPVIRQEHVVALSPRKHFSNHFDNVLHDLPTRCRYHLVAGSVRAFQSRENSAVSVN